MEKLEVFGLMALGSEKNGMEQSLEIAKLIGTMMIYGMIHELQPQALIGNNHHIGVINGEDFQMFEKDLPGKIPLVLEPRRPNRKPST